MRRLRGYLFGLVWGELGCWEHLRAEIGKQRPVGSFRCLYRKRWCLPDHGPDNQKKREPTTKLGLELEHSIITLKSHVREVLVAFARDVCSTLFNNIGDCTVG